NGSLIITGGDGNDTITLSGILNLPGVALVIQSEHIAVGGATVDTTGGTTNGSITLAAANTQTGSGILGVVILSGAAGITITGATVKSGTINATATSTISPTDQTSSAAALSATSTANVAVTGSTVQSSGDTTLRAESVVASTM